MTHRLFLHIGTHKTGTTSIQRFLASNREALRRQGFVYPENSLGGFKDHYAHHRIAHAMAERPCAGNASDARGFFDALRRNLAGGEAAIISAEALYRHVVPSDDANSVAFDAGGGVAGDPLTYIQTVRECIGEFDVTLLVMLRRQDLFIESLYAEQVMSSSYSAGINRFLGQRTWLADYEARLGMWADVFGDTKLSVRIFDPRSFGMPIERYFVEWLGGKWDDDFAPGALFNVTVPRSLVEYKRALNDNQPRSVSTRYRRWLEKLAREAPDGALPDLGRYYLGYEDRQEFLRQFEAGNRRLAERYFGRAELFDASAAIDRYDKPAGLDRRNFRTITRLLLRSIAG